MMGTLIRKADSFRAAVHRAASRPCFAQPRLRQGGIGQYVMLVTYAGKKVQSEVGSRPLGLDTEKVRRYAVGRLFFYVVRLELSHDAFEGITVQASEQGLTQKDDPDQ